MNMGSLVTLSLVLLFALVALYLIGNAGRRRAEDVVGDLSEDPTGDKMSLKQRPGRSTLNDYFGAIGLYDENERRTFRLKQRLIPVGFGLAALLYHLVRGRAEVGAVLLSCGVGLGLGYLASQMLYRRRQARFIRELEFFLPIVMERMVMAVQSGLDVIPALKAIVALDRKQSADGLSENEKPDGKHWATDPVSRLLAVVCRLTEAGLSFEQALRDIAGQIECPALRHAFIHLAVAQREGGEVIMPLRELSDSTQLYYQESVEEEIAKLPVKATMPLLCTFAGLVIFFITSPIIQVLEMTMKAMPK